MYPQTLEQCFKGLNKYLGKIVIALYYELDDPNLPNETPRSVCGELVSINDLPLNHILTVKNIVNPSSLVLINCNTQSFVEDDEYDGENGQDSLETNNMEKQKAPYLVLRELYAFDEQGRDLLVYSAEEIQAAWLSTE